MPTTPYINLTLNFVPNPAPNFGGGLNVNQQNVANTLVNFFNSTGGIPAVFGSLAPQGLTQASGELATASQQTTFDAMNLFLGLLTDPFVAGRGDRHDRQCGCAALRRRKRCCERLRSERQAAQQERARSLCRGLSQGVDTRQLRSALERMGGGLWRLADHRRQYRARLEHCDQPQYSERPSAPTTCSRRAPLPVSRSPVAAPISVSTGSAPAAPTCSRPAPSSVTPTGPLMSPARWLTAGRTSPPIAPSAVAGGGLLRANFSANAFSGRVEGGYRFVTPWMAMGITPYAAGQFTTFDLPAYVEQAITGGNMFALAYGAKSVTASRSELGLRTDKSFAMQDGIFTLRGRAAWAHNFDPDRNIGATFQTLPGASFVVNGAAQARDAALVTGSAEMKWLNGFSLAATFEGEFSSVTRSYAGKGVVRYAW